VDCIGGMCAALQHLSRTMRNLPHQFKNNNRSLMTLQVQELMTGR
jgi:hypothetical protein